MVYNWQITIMKKTLLLVLATLFATVTFAQQQLATLNHNDSITVFYGISALQQAHAAAVAGDIITLSPGSFNAVNITKAVTIRGAGMFPDTTTGSDNTVIPDNFRINVPNDTLNMLSIEGIYCARRVEFNKANSPNLIKCFFYEIMPTGGIYASYTTNALFINCIILDFQNNNSYISNPQFVNSVILQLENNTGNPTLVNCIAKPKQHTPGYLNSTYIRNSVVYQTDDNFWSGPNEINAFSSYNSVGIYAGNSTNSTATFFNINYLSGHNLHNYRGFASVFKEFRGTYSYNISFELLDTVAATCLGSDGTQVGIYGGIMPFDPSVRNPLIKKCNVASRSTADGKLAVDIEIVSE